MRAHSRELLLSLLLAAIVGAYLCGVGRYVTLQSLKDHHILLEQIVAEHYVLSVLLYMLLYISTAIAVPAALILTVAAGLLFHMFPGVIYATISATAGGLVAFILSRYVIGSWLQTRYQERLKQLNQELDRNGHLYLITARLIPILPFFLVNYLCGLTRLSLWTFAWATAAGIFPASLVYTFAGTQIGSISSTGDLAAPRVLLSFLLLALLAFLPVIWKKLRSRRQVLSSEDV